MKLPHEKVSEAWQQSRKESYQSELEKVWLISFLVCDTHGEIPQWEISLPERYHCVYVIPYTGNQIPKQGTLSNPHQLSPLPPIRKKAAMLISYSRVFSIKQHQEI